MRNTADLLVDQFESYGIEYVFCVPGASIDAITTSLLNRKITKLIMCRLEDEAGYAAISYAKKTGKPAVVMVTDGPGATNVVTAAATATLEHVPLIIICGQGSTSIKFKPSHQIIDAKTMFMPVTKYSYEIDSADNLSSIWDFTYFQSITPAKGAVHLSIPSNILALENNMTATAPLTTFLLPHAQDESLSIAAKLINQAKCPVMILGGDAVDSSIALAIKSLMDNTPIATVVSFAGTGLINRKHIDNFMGKLGIFQNQPCNILIKESDVILSVGYNIAELDPISWNQDDSKAIIHISDSNPIVAKGYRPSAQLLGDIASNLNRLSEKLTFKGDMQYQALKTKVRKELLNNKTNYKIVNGLVHPLYIISCMQEVITDIDTLISDVGSAQYWTSEYFFSYVPRQYINSMGFQTLGVSLGFAVGAALSQKNNPAAKVYSISGDGGVLMGIMELATAVENNLPIIHLIWVDHSYNLIAIQEEKKYHKLSAEKFNKNIDFVKMAEAFGATGLRVRSADELLPALKIAKTILGPVIIEIPVDYKDNLKMLLSD